MAAALRITRRRVMRNRMRNMATHFCVTNCIGLVVKIDAIMAPQNCTDCHDNQYKKEGRRSARGR